MDIREKIIEQIRVSDLAVQRLRKEAAEASAWREKVAQEIPNAVEALIANGHVAEDKREKLAEVLQDPAKTIQLLTKVANRTAGVSDDFSVGRSASSSGYAAAGVKTAGVKESDLVLFRALGLPDPTE